MILMLLLNHHRMQEANSEMLRAAEETEDKVCSDTHTGLSREPQRVPVPVIRTWSGKTPSRRPHQCVSQMEETGIVPLERRQPSALCAVMLLIKSRQ